MFSWPWLSHPMYGYPDKRALEQNSAGCKYVLGQVLSREVWAQVRPLCCWGVTATDPIDMAFWHFLLPSRFLSLTDIWILGGEHT